MNRIAMISPVLGLLLFATAEAETKPETPPTSLPGMRTIPAGTFQMGSSGRFETDHGPKNFPEEAPIQTATLKTFQIDETEVTNRAFAKFIAETGYVTFAEREARLADFPPEAHASLPKEKFHQGSVIFSKPASFTGDPSAPGSFMSWWRWDPEANWRHPWGKDSSIDGLEDHPVVCVNHEDASAYAKWAGKRLPTEAEWEYAARGGLAGKIYNWGDEMKPDGKWMANTFQGKFPTANTDEDGFDGTAPAKKFPANGYGLYDMAGNVWEICADRFQSEKAECPCGASAPEKAKSLMLLPSEREPAGPVSYVLKGGSFLCHVSYCMRYRPAARHSLEEGSPANHVGFRCIKD